LTKADKVWLKPYLTVDTVLFKSDKNRIDTFALDAKDGIYEDYTTCSKFELGPNTYNYSGASLQSKERHGSGNRGFSIGITKDHQEISDLECIKNVQVFDFYADFVYESDTNLKVEYLSVPLNHKRTKTYFFEMGDQFSGSHKSKIISCNWSKKCGLVRYVLFTGEVYDLYKKW
jgi:uncharacterized protein YneR